MIPTHREYKVEIKRLKFESEKGIRYPHTALVHFYLQEIFLIIGFLFFFIFH